MDERSVGLMFALLNSVLFGKTLTEEQKVLFSNDNVKTLLEQAHRHNVLHLVAKGLIDNDLIAKDHPYFSTCQKAQVMAIYSYEGLNYELQQLSKLFDEAKISFLPLKGSVLRDYYPEPWMRSSCDIDVLVKPEDFDRALTLFVQGGSVRYR